MDKNRSSYVRCRYDFCGQPIRTKALGRNNTRCTEQPPETFHYRNFQARACSRDLRRSSPPSRQNRCATRLYRPYSSYSVLYPIPTFGPICIVKAISMHHTSSPQYGHYTVRRAVLGFSCAKTERNMRRPSSPSPPRLYESLCTLKHFITTMQAAPLVHVLPYSRI